MRVVIFSLLLSLVVLACSKPPAQQPEAKFQKIHLAVEGMVCTSCEQSIQTKLTQLDGVKSVAVSKDKKEAVVEFDASKVSEQDFIAAIESLGYKATRASESSLQ